MENKLACSIGVIVFNEAANIGKLLDALLQQKSDKTKIPTAKSRSHRYQDAPNRVKKPWQIPKQPNLILKSLTKPPAVLARAAS